jgi:hypothetical protein
VASNLTITLLKHHVVGKLESILDRESKISHEQLATTIESRLGYGEGANAKGPDMKVWGQSKALADVSPHLFTRFSLIWKVYLRLRIGL